MTSQTVMTLIYVQDSCPKDAINKRQIISFCSMLQTILFVCSYKFQLDLYNFFFFDAMAKPINFPESLSVFGELGNIWILVAIALQRTSDVGGTWRT